MVSVTKTWFVDDLDGVSPAVEELTWSFQGADYIAHVSREHADEFKAVMARFTQNATKVGGRRFDPRPLRSEKWTVEDEDERKQIRDWAVSNDMYVSEHGGRTPDEYLRKYCAPNRPDKRNAARRVEAPTEPEASVPEEPRVIGKMTEHGVFYESFDDAVMVANAQGRHAIPKDGGGLVVIEVGVSYQQSLKELAAKEKAERDARERTKAAAVKPNKNSTRAVLRKLTAETSMWHTALDSMNLDTKEDFVQQAKAWLGDKTEVSNRTLELADWDEVYEYARSDRQAKARQPKASAEVGSRTEPARTVEVGGSVADLPKKAAPRTRAKTGGAPGKAVRKPVKATAKAKPAEGDGVVKASHAATSNTSRRPAATTPVG